MQMSLGRSVTIWLAAAAASGSYCAAEEMRIDLSRSDAAASWMFLRDGGRIQNGEMVLDGREDIAPAFLEPHAWGDVKLQARFMVEPSAQGVLACGFIVRAQDAETYYYVHYDRQQAILVRSDPKVSWNELKRTGNLDRPAGQWHEAAIECVGDSLKVHLNGHLLYEARDPQLKHGRVGFYGSQGIVHIKDIVITGRPMKPENKLAPPQQRFAYVCRDAGAGAYEAFPDVCRLCDGRLLCVFYAGYGHIALPNAQLPKGGRIAFCTSSDEGRTWSKAQTLYDGPNDDRDPSITQLQDGRLVCTFFSLEAKPGGGYRCPGSTMIVSRDLGRTWSEPTLIAKDYYCSSPVRELSDGRLVLGLYAERPDGQWGAVTCSSDGGQSWNRPVDIASAGMPLAAETDVIRLRDGTLYAALRAESGSCAWSASADNGRSWSTARPMGFPGHCPYLHRAADGAICLAQRLPETCLRISRDECRTWSEPIAVDAFIGAYPSMVTLRDGSVLIVYYEEGDQSSIRAKRFRLTGSGVQWLPPADESLARCGLRTESVSRIWDFAPHNAFTDLVRHGDKLFCVFREATGHGVSPTGSIRILCSRDDGCTWQSAALITSPGLDLRDPKITLTPDRRLMVYAAGVQAQAVAGVTHRNYVWFSPDGKDFGKAAEIGEPNIWLWRVTWHKGTAYGVGYSVTSDRLLRLYTSTDGNRFTVLVPNMGPQGYANETSTIIFSPDGTARVLLRRDPEVGMIGTASHPYRDWVWQPLDCRLGGPEMRQLPDGRLLAAVRLYDNPVRTSLAWVDPQKRILAEVFSLPSGGDTSYAGIAASEDDRLWLSYYSSHEGRTCIYLAVLRLDGKTEPAR
ncbi:MAG: exo-alpha-sialidase [Phycisphaerae bacterium]|nr:exo-alpha-sialidase [Phycisphaerae bacterium]